MPEQRRPESADLTDYEVQEASDSLDGDTGEDPLDRGVAPPQRWSAAIRHGSTTAAEQQAGESLDQLLAEEEPDVTADTDDEPVADLAGDEEAGELMPGDGTADPRAGRLVAEDEGAHPDEEADLVAHDTGIAGGAATAEEAAMHVVDDDTGSRPGR
jgi:Family of unknown function (DUF5709)